jgi:hypothetical protein
VAGRFRLYTDTDVDGPVVKALRRVLVSNDIDMKLIAETWFLEGRSFPGLVWWPRRHYAVISPGDFVAAFEELAALEEPFSAYPIVHIKPKR